MPQASSAQMADTLYFQHFQDTMNLRLIWVNKGLNLRVSGADGDSLASYNPQYRPYAGFGGFLWNIGFNFLLPLPQPQRREQIKRFNFQASLFAKYWLIDGIYQRYKGFEANLLGPQTEQLPVGFQDEMLTRKIQASITYLPGGKNLALRAPFNQGVRQLKSAGSFLLSGSFTYLKMQDENGLLPAAWLAAEDPLLQQLRVASFSGMLGYATTLVFRNMIFLHLYGLSGIGFQQKSYSYEQTEQAFSLRPVHDARAALAFDNGKFYAGVYGLLDHASFQVEQWNFRQISTQLRLYIGIRFTEPLFIQKLKPKFLERLRNSPNLPLPPIFG